MLLTVSEFRERATGSKLDQLIEELANKTGRNNPAEKQAWADSFACLANALKGDALGQVHLYLGDLGGLALEYRLPASASWCDAVLLGHDGQQPSAVILELKHWDTRHDSSVPHSGLIERPSGLTLHPSEQVKGYVQYCRNFHSTIHEKRAAVGGCVLFTARPLSHAYLDPTNAALTSEYPCFSIATNSESSAAIAYLNLRLAKSDREFAEKFAAGHYRQDRNFIRAIGDTLRSSPNRRLELLDEQRLGLCVALAAVREAVANVAGKIKKRVVVIEGPPGSGKSAIAASLWAELATDKSLPFGDLAFVTTSTAQNHSLEHLFGAGRGVVKKATSFTPATTQELGRLKGKFPGQFDDVSKWREHVEVLRNLVGEFDPRDDAYLVSIVDEAHALVNPEMPDGRGQFGFAVNFGPQAYHIIRSSTVSVFLLDEQQGFREQETTSRRDIERWAKELGAEVMPTVSLSERQFRCGGSTEYIAWVEGLLSARARAELTELASFWRVVAPSGLLSVESERVAEPGVTNVVPFPSPRRRFKFELVDSPAELDAILSAHHREAQTVRLVSSYARKWVTEKAAWPHSLPGNLQDFHLTWRSASGLQSWSRVWNWRGAPEGYVGWIDPSPGVPMADNPLAEVGCPYTVRGFDYDYLGVLWLSDIVWRKDHWEVIPNNVFESGLRRHRQRAANERSMNDPHHRALLTKLCQGYRILLTRALKGIYVWCEDPETAEHLKGSLGE